jgi:acetylornithine deacetylase/succinyl-diaminopimelate desuccinylase family protein
MINRDRLIKLTQQLIAINSENPPGNEWACGQFITKKMRDLGLAVKTYTYAKKRPNIVAVLKGSLPRAQARDASILLTPHYDTVPIGQGWRMNPLGGEIRKGRIYGRGASDDKGNLACCMEVMESFVEDGIRFKGDVVMAATAEEETGSRYGIIPLLAEGILKPRAALIVDSFAFDTVIAQKGLIHCRVQIAGKKAHGAYNWLGVNAIEIGARVIHDIKQYVFSYVKHPLLHPPTINVGTIRGGDKVNMVADFCEFSLDIRFLPGMSHETILKDIKALIRSHTKNFKICIDDLQQPYEIDRDHPMIQIYLSRAKALKVKSTLKGSEGATVISFFKKHQIPAFATGFGTHGTAHATDEYAEVELLHKGAILLEDFVRVYDAM